VRSNSDRLCRHKQTDVHNIIYIDLEINLLKEISSPKNTFPKNSFDPFRMKYLRLHSVKIQWSVKFVLNTIHNIYQIKYAYILILYYTMLLYICEYLQAKHFSLTANRQNLHRWCPIAPPWRRRTRLLTWTIGTRQAAVLQYNPSRRQLVAIIIRSTPVIFYTVLRTAVI
jgi:hypothetical protein